jgi:hypothetical protein
MSTEKHMLTLYTMTESEQASAQLLAEPNLRMIKNLLATDTIRLTNLVPDPNNYPKFVQEHAEIKGAISAWQFLINCHEEVINRLAVE